jgi:transcriptional regulator with XRE-family HTH domain
VSERAPFAARLRELIDASGLSVSEVARRLNVTRATVYNLLNGTHTDPAFSLVQRIADVFGVTTDSLRDPTS